MDILALPLDKAIFQWLKPLLVKAAHHGLVVLAAVHAQLGKRAVKLTLCLIRGGSHNLLQNLDIEVRQVAVLAEGIVYSVRS